MPGPFAIQNADGTRTLDLLGEAPATDTGQLAVPVRVLSQLGAGTGGGGATGGLTDAELRATPVDVAIVGGAQGGGLTDAELRASPVPVSIAGGSSSGGLTDVELRASPVPVSGTVNVGNLPAVQPVSGSVGVNNFPAVQPVSGSVGINNWPASQPVTGTFWPATQPVSNQPATNAVSQTGTAAASVTATLPAAGAGMYHYISRINISAYATAARTGSATPTVVTTGNLPGSIAWTVPTAMAVGTQYETDIQLTSPLRSVNANANTTIVAPGATSVIWRINVVYYTGP